MTKPKVLIPLDGSEFSRQIIPWAIRLLNPDTYQIVLLRVLPPLSGFVSTPARALTVAWPQPMYDSVRDVQLAIHPIYESQMWENVQATGEDEMLPDVRRLQSVGFDVTTITRLGGPAPEIIACAQSEGVDFVAMATHGRSGLSRLVLGSVAETVVHNLPIPVLLLRPTTLVEDQPTPADILVSRLAAQKPLRLTVATDGSPYSKEAVTLAGHLARTMTTSPSMVVSVQDSDDVAESEGLLSEARALLGPTNSPVTCTPLVGFADETILLHLEEHPADLLVMGAFRDRGATNPSALGRTASRLIQHAPSSILLVKGHQTQCQKLLVCSAVGDEAVVEAGARLAQALGAGLQVLHIIPPSAGVYLTRPDQDEVPLDEILHQETPLARYLRRCEARLEAAGFSRDVLKIRQGELPITIYEEARTGDFDTIVIGSNAGPGKSLGSIADRLVRYAYQSVLVVRTS